MGEVERKHRDEIYIYIYSYVYIIYWFILLYSRNQHNIAKEFSSVAQSCPTLCESMDCSTLGFPVHHQHPELAQTPVCWISSAIHHLVLCHPLLLLPSIFPRIRVFSESALHIRWPKYCSFSISLSNEYSGLIPFRIDWFDLLAV